MSGQPLIGQMMERPLLVSALLEHAESTHATSEIVSRRCEGDIHRYTIKDAAVRARKLANLLSRFGVQQGDRIATLAWNGYRHWELYYGVSGYGAVLHTINPRLFAEQLVYIINHAEDRYLFVDLTFVPLLEKIQDQISRIEGFVILCDEDKMPDTSLPNALCYETLLANEPDDFSWPEFDERAAASMCYTSGTTGNPKGVLYSHRSTVLHAMASIGEEALGLASTSCFLPVVPMFHVNAWGTPYSAAITGAKQVFPGPGMDGASLWELIDAEKPDLMLGVPTVWLMLLNHMDSIGKKLESVKNVVVGGSAAPMSMIRDFNEKHDAFLIHAWGMTEMSPIGTVNSHNIHTESLPLEERYKLQAKQGRPVYGVEMKIVDDDNNTLPQDGVARGRLLVRGPWIVSGYYNNDDRSSFIDGWFDTGDVATIDENNYLTLVDRSKDVIKSGGEWISSIDLENAAVGHPELAECCVIAARHDKWAERPVLLAVRNEGAGVDEAGVLKYLEDKVAKWWLPDAVVFVDSLPHTATGKLLKVDLRKTYENYLLEKV
ncbi:MAG: long-chain fatty acid--CoA ligase [Oceanospirillaceae bacterium]|mgnify:FL=1|uniref:long-chain-fatty-acid--CoA ligase n=1 Tax=unclassified Thalassolituus TaxID=2624967 RepID=UPI000C4C0B42|nr:MULTISPECIES: long-chain-fatty-acid--CoA ligase [unclassified Thalassolituus]MAS23993.1 long-chain fatty acid--CoA ligase [Oceanospirillaceae bacterium]MBL36679.1 long-chain fatty acid--CoA ligase [Oceanospirillaceae bacterium]MBS54463.1 long-chain fatty acid--CoA ligase [Oceanospirillaceae bacterium]|tara:strand:- start:1143 stop:2783 length:1641 start_codon:yes stop_codon:yes gene_type:complete